jgi:tol-pal system protein YbgF
MNIKTIFLTFTLLILSIFNINKCFSQDNGDVITNINERILNKIDGLNTKINDLERRVYQGKEPNLNNQNQEIINNNNYRSEADHERRLLELEEKTRAIEGLIEELNYLKEQINKLTQQNSNLLIQIENLNKDSTIDKNIIEQNISEEPPATEYPIYPGMNNDESSTVEVLAKIDTTNGSDEIIKQTIDGQENNLQVNNVQEIEINSQETSIIKPSKKPEEIYQRAYNMLSKGNYEAAEVAFIKFIKDFSDHSLTSNAYYWLGETFYVRKNYIQAAQNFAAGYKKFPKGSKASAQLLKLGISLYALNKNKEACSAFSKLDKEFEELSVSITSRANTYKEKLDCQ